MWVTHLGCRFVLSSAAYRCMKKHTKFREVPTLGSVTVAGERQRGREVCVSCPAAIERQRQQQRRDTTRHGTAQHSAARYGTARGAARRVSRQHNTLTWFETAPANPLDITCDSRGCLACLRRRRRRRRASNDGGGGGDGDRIGGGRARYLRID